MNADFKARIARIRETVSLPDLLLSYGVTLRQSGNGYIAKCISHEDNNPSMSVYRADNFNGYLCICHACSFKGDVVDVYEKLTGTDTAEAVAAQTVQRCGPLLRCLMRRCSILRRCCSTIFRSFFPWLILQAV